MAMRLEAIGPDGRLVVITEAKMRDHAAAFAKALERDHRKGGKVGDNYAPMGTARYAATDLVFEQRIWSAPHAATVLERCGYVRLGAIDVSRAYWGTWAGEVNLELTKSRAPLEIVAVLFGPNLWQVTVLFAERPRQNGGVKGWLDKLWN